VSMARRNHRPPAIAAAMLRMLLNHRHPESVMGDYEEHYRETAREKGAWYAGFWFRVQVLLLLPSFINNSIYWSMNMFGSHASIAFRHVRKYKVYSFINIVGLALGMASVIVILLWVTGELSYDTFHENRDRIFRTVFEEETGGKVTRYWQQPAPLGPVMKNDFPEIEDMTRYITRNTIAAYDDRVFEEKVAFADPSFLKIFTVSLVNGDPGTALDNPDAIIITERVAEKFFGSENPVNKTIRLNNQHDYTITGVMNDMPANSTLRFDALAPFTSLAVFEDDEGLMETWGTFGYNTFLLLNDKSDGDILSQKIAGYIENHIDFSYEIRLILLPFSDMHLHALNGGGPIVYVYVFSFIAIIVLLIACINFINLSVSQYLRRAREVGIRKALGANKASLVRQFYSESKIFIVIAFFIAVVLAYLLLPVMNNITGQHLTLQNIPAEKQLFLWAARIILQKDTRGLPVFSIRHADNLRFYRI